MQHFFSAEVSHASQGCQRLTQNRTNSIRFCHSSRIAYLKVFVLIWVNRSNSKYVVNLNERLNSPIRVETQINLRNCILEKDLGGEMNHYLFVWHISVYQCLKIPMCARFIRTHTTIGTAWFIQVEENHEPWEKSTPSSHGPAIRPFSFPLCKPPPRSHCI